MHRNGLVLGRLALCLVAVAFVVAGSTAPARAGCVPEIPNNGIDEDCDGVDSCYQDLDNDNWGTPTIIHSNDLDCADNLEAGVTGDCNDGNPNIFPGATEIVGDEIDEDCNNQELCYRDNDNDDFGTPTVINSVDVDCDDALEASFSGDCNDSNPNIYPGATEIVGDEIDQDCNGTERCYQDNDNDNFGSPTVINSTDVDCDDNFEASVSGDCSDSNPNVYPGAPEVVNNGVDENCNGVESCYRDMDTDNWGVNVVQDSSDLDCADANEAPVTGDCNDGNPNVFPGAPEVVNNGTDEDCDGVESCYRDADNDNWGVNVVQDSTDLDCADANEAPVTGDCNDGNPNVFPGAPEVVNDGIDQDCDGVESCYRDADNDDWGVNVVQDSTDLDCVDAFEATVTGDCEDGNPAINPGATEICNGLDDNCDTQIDPFPAPAGVPSFSLTSAMGSTQLSWPSVPSATVYDVVKGGLQSLASSVGDFTAATTGCVANDVAATSTTDAAMPGAGSGFWYLVRAVNCSTPGTYESGAMSQVGLRDPEIGASPARCP